MNYKKPEYEGTVKEINGESATVEMTSKDFKKFDAVFHVDMLAKQNSKYVGARIIYDPNNREIKPYEQHEPGLFSKIFGSR